jgi:hypothetical protein
LHNDDKEAAMETYELAVLAGLNASSIFGTLWFLKAVERRRKYKIGKMILEDMGERAQVDMNFMNIIKQNFGGSAPNPEEDDN